MADDFGPGSTPGNPAGFVAGAIREGQSANAALNAFREAGGAMRTQSFYRLFGEVGASLAKAGAAGELDPFAIPQGADYATWAMGRGGQYVTSVNVHFRDLGSGVIGSSRYDYVTDVPHAPGEAELAAYDEFSDPDNADNYDQTILGTSIANVYQTVAFEG